MSCEDFKNIVILLYSIKKSYLFMTPPVSIKVLYMGAIKFMAADTRLSKFLFFHSNVIFNNKYLLFSLK